MENQPFISVIIVCYNYGHLLPRTLDAIAKQTFRDFEVVFVNNACTDNSAEIVQQFMEVHSEINLKIVTVEKNIGPAHGDNVGASAATGKYLLFNDADDWMDDNTLELLAEAAVKTDADRVIASFRDINDDGKLVKVRSVGERPVMWLHTMQQANLFRTEIYHRNHITVEHGWLDAEKTMCFSQYVKKVAFVQEPCYNYLVHTDSFSRKELYKRLWNEKESLDLLMSKFRMVYDALDDQESRDWAEYQCIRTYFSYMFQYLRNASLKTKLENYPKLHKIMKTHFPTYGKNSKVTVFRREGDQFASRLMFWGLVTAENLHLMKLVLTLYHLLSAFTYLHI